MSALSGVKDFFGLDIGTSAIRLVQLRGSGPVKALVKYALVPIDTKIVLSDAKSDQQKVAAVVQDLITQSKITTKNVAVGLPSSRVFTTVVDIEKLTQDELAKTIRYQANSLIPTSIPRLTPVNSSISNCFSYPCSDNCNAPRASVREAVPPRSPRRR